MSIYILGTELNHVFAVCPFHIVDTLKSAPLHIRCKCCTFDSMHVCDVTRKTNTLQQLNHLCCNSKTINALKMLHLHMVISILILDD